MVAIASQNGRTKITNRAIVITATASPRLRQSRNWTCSIIGHVATTKVVAQIIAGRNGHKIQNEVAISPPTKRTARVVRVSSEGASIPQSLESGHSRLQHPAHCLSAASAMPIKAAAESQLPLR